MTDLTNRAICRFVLLLIILLLAIAPAQAGQWLAASALSGGENGALDAILAGGDTDANGKTWYRALAAGDTAMVKAGSAVSFYDFRAASEIIE